MLQKCYKSITRILSFKNIKKNVDFYQNKG